MRTLQLGAHPFIWGTHNNSTHVLHNMSTVMPCTGSCRVTPGKHRLLQHPWASPMSIARHDPEAECSSPDGREGGEEEQTRPRIRQSVAKHIQPMQFFIPFSPLER